MKSVRVIPCLDVDQGRVVKGVNFVGLRDAGDPVELAARYDADGADEVVFLDITASSDDRETIVELARKVAEEVYIPFTIGGGVRSVDDARRLLRAGADKVSATATGTAGGGGGSRPRSGGETFDFLKVLSMLPKNEAKTGAKTTQNTYQPLKYANLMLELLQNLVIYRNTMCFNVISCCLI